MPISQQFTSVFSKEWEINFTQCFPNGRLKYTDLCTIFQLTAAAHSEMGGISFSDMQHYEQAWVLSKMIVEIKELPKWKDIVIVKTWINTLENSRSVRALELYSKGIKIAGCETYWVVFNTTTRRPETLALPINHFVFYPSNKATIKSCSKINLSDTFQDVAHKTVLISDLDIVNHVNNVKYLEWCCDYLNIEILLHSKVKSFEMNFTKELSRQDTVVIKQNLASNRCGFKITRDDQTCFVLQLDLK